MTDYGAKVTIEGAAVTSSNPSDYILDSKYDVFKTYIVGTANFSFSNEADTQTNHNIITVTHSLGYKPFCVMYWNKNSSQFSGDFWIESQGTPHNCYEFIAFNVTTSDFKIDYTYHDSGLGDGVTGISSYNFGFKYYIMYNKGEP